MRRALFAVTLFATLGLSQTLSAHEASKGGVTIAHPWVRANPGGSTLTAAFMEIKSAAGDGDALIAASSPAAGRVEVHTHIKDGDVMKMRRLDKLPVTAGQSHVLKPSGDHLMLLDLKAPLKDGDLVKLSLTFEKAGTIEIEATVEPVGAMGPHGMGEQPVDGGENSGDAHKHH